MTSFSISEGDAPGYDAEMKTYGNEMFGKRLRPSAKYDMTPYTASPMKNIAVMTGFLMAKRVSHTVIGSSGVVRGVSP